MKAAYQLWVTQAEKDAITQGPHRLRRHHTHHNDDGTHVVAYLHRDPDPSAGSASDSGNR